MAFRARSARGGGPVGKGPSKQPSDTKPGSEADADTELEREDDGEDGGTSEQPATSTGATTVAIERSGYSSTIAQTTDSQPTAIMGLPDDSIDSEDEDLDFEQKPFSWDMKSYYGARALSSDLKKLAVLVRKEKFMTTSGYPRVQALEIESKIQGSGMENVFVTKGMLRRKSKQFDPHPLWEYFMDCRLFTEAQWLGIAAHSKDVADSPTEKGINLPSEVMEKIQFVNVCKAKVKKPPRQSPATAIPFPIPVATAAGVQGTEQTTPANGVGSSSSSGPTIGSTAMAGSTLSHPDVSQATSSGMPQPEQETEPEDETSPGEVELGAMLFDVTAQVTDPSSKSSSDSDGAFSPV